MALRNRLLQQKSSSLNYFISMQPSVQGEIKYDLKFCAIKFSIMAFLIMCQIFVVQVQLVLKLLKSGA